MTLDPAAELRLAFHEAGHAVVALALGCHVGRISAPRTRDHTGDLHWQSWVELHPDHLKSASILLAGQLAARLHGVSSGWLLTRLPDGTPVYRTEERMGCEDDLHQVRLLALSKYAGSDDPLPVLGWLDRANRRARHILTRPGHWQATHAIALALLETEVLAAHELQQWFFR